MADDLRSTLEAAVATVEKQQTAAPAPAPAPSPAPAPAAPAPAPAADKTAALLRPKEGENADPYAEKQGESGKTSGSESTDPAKIEQNPGDNQQEGKNDEESAEERTSRAPQSWKPGPKAKWAALDPEVRAEVVRRERDVTKALAETTQARKFASTFQEVIKPFVPRFQQAGVHPMRAIQSLLHIDQVMSSASVADRAKYAAKWLKDYQVDINALDAALAGEDPSTAAPEAVIDRMLAQRLAPVEEFINSSKQERERQVQADFERQQAAVEAMATDPKFPDFDLVREDMADIIEINLKRGVALTAEQAYTRAVAMNPDAQAAVTARSKQAQANKANESAQRALGASLSVSGNPSTMRTNVPPTDLRGTIEAAFQAVQGR